MVIFLLYPLYEPRSSSLFHTNITRPTFLYTTPRPARLLSPVDLKKRKRIGLASTTGATRLDLDGDTIRPLRICMIGAGGFIGSHLFEKLLAGTPHKVLAVDIYSDKIENLLQPPPEYGRIQFHRLNIKNDSRLESLIKMSELLALLPLSLSLTLAPPPTGPFSAAPIAPPPFLQIRFSAGKIKHLLESPLGARPDPIPPTQHQERLPTRGPHQDFGSG